jgi:asparagine synthase (glutamine-hydrolysing)
MCRIAGIIDFKNVISYDIESTISCMRDSMQAGGPDDKGNFITHGNDYTLAFGHRRLSIIDLSKCGHQPMLSVDGNVVIIFNGEIYNYQEIRTELIKSGKTFTTNSDTEVIIQAYETWGIQSVNKFIGMFAFLLFDVRQQIVYAVRDRAGVKPLFYYHHENLLLFGSELKSFHQHPNFKKEINVNALGLLLQFSYIPAPHCIFKNTHKVLPGHYLSINLKNQVITDNIYWNVQDLYKQPVITNMSLDEIINNTENILSSACNYRMVADVPVGVFLSGGYDSSLVTALLQKDKTDKIRTFTIGFHEKKYNEAPYGKLVAEHLQTDHTEVYCTQKDALDIIPLLPDIYDEPFGDSSAIATILVSRIAKQSVKVALSADGGDELFGGYTKYSSVIKVKQKMSSTANINKSAAFLLNLINPEHLFANAPLIKKIAKLARMLQSKGMNEMLYWHDCANTSAESTRLIKQPFNSNNTDLYSTIEANDEINSMLAIDYLHYLPDDILTKIDRATMSVGLEGREPLLDHRLPEWTAQIPGDVKIKNGTKKYILKEIVHKYIPSSIMNRPKMGFGVPITEWFKKELKDYFETYLSIPALQKHDLFNNDRVQKRKELYFNGNDRIAPELWNLLMFQMWYERWMK